MDQNSSSDLSITKNSKQQKILDFSPKGYLIRYPFLLDRCVKRFIDDFQDDFKQLKNGTFKLKAQLSRKALSDLFQKYFSEELSKVISSVSSDTEKCVWFFVSDSGDLRRKNYQTLETDIDIGLKNIEKTANKLFNRLLAHRQQNPNVVYCKHSSLLSEDWAKILSKKIFGKENFSVLDSAYEMQCIKEELDEEFYSKNSKKENALLVKECVEWIKSQMS